MNERDAISFIMEELKEQRRHDFEMYFEMRQHTTSMYNALLERLREVDDLERHMKVPGSKEIRNVKGISEEKARELYNSIRTEYASSKPLGQPVAMVDFNSEAKVLPEPKTSMTPEELRVDKYDIQDLEDELEELDKLELEEDPDITIANKLDEEKETVQHDKPPVQDLVTAKIIEFLQKKGTWCHFAEIQTYVEAELEHEFLNFSNNVKRATNVSKHIQVKKINARKFLYKFKS